MSDRRVSAIGVGVMERTPSMMQIRTGVTNLGQSLLGGSPRQPARTQTPMHGGKTAATCGQLKQRVAGVALW